MAEKTSIGWCDATINFWHGCQKVSEGCKYCYMYRDKEKYGQNGNDVKKTDMKTVNRILHVLHKECHLSNEPLKIFTCSWSDFFLKEADSWRQEAWEVIRNNPEFIWIILTKRPERVKECLPEDWGAGWGHVWLLVSAENQARAEERIPLLLDIPAKVRGVSVEPILGPVDLTRLDTFRFNYDEYCMLNSLTGDNTDMGRPFYDKNKLDWVIIGGESGNDTGKWKYREAELNWFISVVEDCIEAGIPVFVKQLGTFIAKKLKLKDRSGSDISQFPSNFQYLKIQQFPNNKP